MKKEITAAVLALAVLCGGCSNEKAEPSSVLDITDVSHSALEKNPQINDEKFQIFEKQLKNFAFISAKKIEETSYVYSPLSLYLTLGCLANGAQGKALEELTAVLTGEELTLGEVNKAVSKWMSAVMSNEMLIMNTDTLLTVNKNYKINKSFAQEILDTYQAATAEADFSNPGIADELNKWVSDKTNGLIKNIVGNELNKETVMVLLNAVYYRGSWTLKFDQERTEKAEFYGKSGVSEVDLMQLHSAEFYYGENEQFQMISLAYEDNMSELYVFLPKGDEADSEDIFEYLQNTNPSEYPLSKRTGQLKLPKFTQETTIDLAEILKSLNVSAMFSGGLGDIVSNAGEDIFIDVIKQKANIIVDEEGTEAAAVTEAVASESMAFPQEPFEMIVNRPFVYVLEIGKIPVFVGSVGDLPLKNASADIDTPD